jgi:hypothetical protein
MGLMRKQKLLCYHPYPENPKKIQNPQISFAKSTNTICKNSSCEATVASTVLKHYSRTAGTETALAFYQG